MTVTEPARTTATSTAPEDRAPGPNAEDIRAKVPFAMTDPHFVPRERYFDQGFFELEQKYLWPYSWLMAARLEEIPSPGDFTEFEIAGSSILIVRQRDHSVKALHNACRHRATELAKGCGRMRGGQIVCPFHGWRWNLDGSSSFVFRDDAFEADVLEPEDLALGECKVEIWAGMVWINMDLQARPLRESLSPVMDLLDAVGVGNMRVKWWKQVVLKANWKLTQEAFFEAYHVMQTHPQLLMGGGLDAGTAMADAIEYTTFRNGHARFQSVGSSGAASDRRGMNLAAFIESGRLLATGQDAMTLDRDIQVFEGLRNRIDPDDPDGPTKAIIALYEYADAAGIPMPPLSPEMQLWGGDIFLFPNFLMLPMYGNCLAYRLRPHGTDPESTLFDVWSLTTYPAGQEPERAQLLGRFDKDDDEHWGLIPRQDFSNIERQQRGLHSHGFDRIRLSSRYELSIANMHEELDRRLAAHL